MNYTDVKTMTKNPCVSCEYKMKTDPFCRYIVETNDEDACAVFDDCTGNDIYGDDGGPDNCWGMDY